MLHWLISKAENTKHFVELNIKHSNTYFDIRTIIVII